jgi:hypothetical protein
MNKIKFLGLAALVLASFSVSAEVRQSGFAKGGATFHTYNYTCGAGTAYAGVRVLALNAASTSRLSAQGINSSTGVAGPIKQDLFNGDGNYSLPSVTAFSSASQGTAYVRKSNGTATGYKFEVFCTDGGTRTLQAFVNGPL